MTKVNDIDYFVRLVERKQESRRRATDNEITRQLIADTAVENYKEKRRQKVWNGFWTALSFIGVCACMTGAWYLVATLAYRWS